MNEFLKNLSKIEFVVTNACTGRCKHCSQGDHVGHGTHIDPKLAADAVRRIVSVYDIKTVMTFGGEPLLCPESVYAIMRAAKECDVMRRQVITNGYFSTNVERIKAVAWGLADAGVNDLLLSVDAFHQETIPLETVRTFALEAKSLGIPVRLQPAWLVSREDSNPYNEKTREILDSLSDLTLPVGDGNVIFPEGSALKYLSEYFDRESLPENPYEEDPRDLRCISFSEDGSVLGGNIYEQDILEIIENYAP